MKVSDAFLIMVTSSDNVTSEEIRYDSDSIAEYAQYTFFDPESSFPISDACKRIHRRWGMYVDYESEKNYIEKKRAQIAFTDGSILFFKFYSQPEGQGLGQKSKT